MKASLSFYLSIYHYIKCDINKTGGGKYELLTSSTIYNIEKKGTAPVCVCAAVNLPHAFNRYDVGWVYKNAKKKHTQLHRPTKTVLISS